MICIKRFVGGREPIDVKKSRDNIDEWWLFNMRMELRTLGKDAWQCEFHSGIGTWFSGNGTSPTGALEAVVAKMAASAKALEAELRSLEDAFRIEGGVVPWFEPQEDEWVFSDPPEKGYSGAYTHRRLPLWIGVKDGWWEGHWRSEIGIPFLMGLDFAPIIEGESDFPVQTKEISATSLIQTLPEKLRETAGTIREDIECLDGVLEDFRDGKLKIEE